MVYTLAAQFPGNKGGFIVTKPDGTPHCDTTGRVAVYHDESHAKQLSDLLEQDS